MEQRYVRMSFFIVSIVFFCAKRWCTAFYIPPKQDQAFNQGGTFLFDGEKTVFAHYDASTGAHSKIDDVIEMARAAKSEKQVKTLA